MRALEHLWRGAPGVGFLSSKIVVVEVIHSELWRLSSGCVRRGGHFQKLVPEKIRGGRVDCSRLFRPSIKRGV